jgi:hypothetical protein
MMRLAFVWNSLTDSLERLDLQTKQHSASIKRTYTTLDIRGKCIRKADAIKSFK